MRTSRGRIGRWSATRTAGELRSRPRPASSYPLYHSMVRLAVHSLMPYAATHYFRCVQDTNTYGLASGGGRCSGQGGPYPPLGLHDFSCKNMGISSGCSDVYDNKLDCQWIDITDSPDGVYWLTVSSE